VKWFVAPLLDADSIRENLNTAPFLIIFNDSDEPFDPTHLFLGIKTTVVCVVKYFSVNLEYRYSFCFP
jgi:hypothetical protein